MKKEVAKKKVLYIDKSQANGGETTTRTRKTERRKKKSGSGCPTSAAVLNQLVLGLGYM